MSVWIDYKASDLRSALEGAIDALDSVRSIADDLSDSASTGGLVSPDQPQRLGDAFNAACSALDSLA